MGETLPLFDVLDGYDELVAETGEPREHWADLLRSLTELGPIGLGRLRSGVARQVDSDGVTYNPVGTAGLATARAQAAAAEQEPAPTHSTSTPWPLDPIPLVLAAKDWARLEEGLAQRARLLAVLHDDLYGPRRSLELGILPPELVFSHRGYVRVAQESPVATRSVLLSAVDLFRGRSGDFLVHADWTGAPSGVGYAVAARRVMMRAAPGVFHTVGPRSLGPFVQALRLALIESAPAGADDPTVVVLSPGTGSETAFDQAHLALLMGFPLVQAPDLVVREGKLWMRSLGTLKRVDVVLRRVDAQFVDPLDLRGDSELGIAGLVEAANRGSVTIVNSIGSGVLENPALGLFLPELARVLLGEELILEQEKVLWAGKPGDRERIVADHGDMVLRDVVSGSSFAAARLTVGEREEFLRKLADAPWRWVGCPPLRLSQAPVLPAHSAGEGELLASAPVLLRCFAMAHGSQQTVMPGGLGQVMVVDEVSGLPVSSVVKDLWVAQSPLAGGGGKTHTSARRVRPVVQELDARIAPVGAEGAVTSPRVLSDLFWMGRYGERAEALARLLIVLRERLQEQRSATGALPVSPVSVADGLAPAGGAGDAGAPLGQDDALFSLFEALAQVAVSRALPAPATLEHALAELRSLTLDRERPGSLAQSVDRLGNAAQGVRDQLSVDTWMVLSDLERALDRPFAAERRTDDGALIGAAQSDVLAGMLALSGLSMESMVHDAGWRIMDSGKRIERGLQLTALVRATLTRQRDPDVERALVEAVLSAAESAVTYRRRHHLLIRIAPVAELLFFDEDNPRSLVYQLEALRRNLQALPDAARSTRAEHALESLFTLLRRARPEELERVSADGERTELEQWLTATHTGLRELAAIIERSRLTPPSRMRPLWADGTGQAWS